MNEERKGTREQKDGRGLPVVEGGRGSTLPRRSDLVVDLSEMEELDTTNLALLLTAQQHAQEEDRAVWLAGVPLEMWRTLHAMGLGRFFRPFPGWGAVAV